MPPSEVLMLAIRSLVAKETNAPDVLRDSYPESFSFFTMTVLFILLSTFCSLHQIIILMYVQT